MTNHDHQRAIDLITLRDDGDTSQPDMQWLEAHLAGCNDCSAYADSLEQTARLLRSTSVMARPSLVSATQLRVRARAAELREKEVRNFFIGLSFCLGVLTSGLTAYLWWSFGSVVANWIGLPPSLVQPGMFVALLLPGVIIAVVMLASSHPVIDRSVTLALLRSREGGRQ